MDIKCFHNPDEENGYLSNWWLTYGRIYQYNTKLKVPA